MTDDDRALLVLYSSKQESLKASSTSALIGKKRKEAKSWLDNEVFDLVDTRKIQVRNWVTGRWVLTLKRDKDGNFSKTKARWVMISRQTVLLHPGVVSALQSKQPQIKAGIYSTWT